MSCCLVFWGGFSFKFLRLIFFDFVRIISYYFLGGYGGNLGSFYRFVLVG